MALLYDGEKQLAVEPFSRFKCRLSCVLISLHNQFKPSVLDTSSSLPALALHPTLVHILVSLSHFFTAGLLERPFTSSTEPTRAILFQRRPARSSRQSPCPETDHHGCQIRSRLGPARRQPAPLRLRPAGHARLTVRRLLHRRQGAGPRGSRVVLHKQ